MSSNSNPSPRPVSVDRSVITILVKNPTDRPGSRPFRIQISPFATVVELKHHLTEHYPGHPPVSAQRLIYAGKLLENPAHLHTIMPVSDPSAIHTIHLVCTRTRGMSPSSSSPVAPVNPEETNQTPPPAHPPFPNNIFNRPPNPAAPYRNPAPPLTVDPAVVDPPPFPHNEYMEWAAQIQQMEHALNASIAAQTQAQVSAEADAHVSAVAAQAAATAANSTMAAAAVQNALLATSQQLGNIARRHAADGQQQFGMPPHECDLLNQNQLPYQHQLGNQEHLAEGELQFPPETFDVATAVRHLAIQRRILENIMRIQQQNHPQHRLRGTPAGAAGHVEQQPQPQPHMPQPHMPQPHMPQPHMQMNNQGQGPINGAFGDPRQNPRMNGVPLPPLGNNMAAGAHGPRVRQYVFQFEINWSLIMRLMVLILILGHEGSSTRMYALISIAVMVYLWQANWFGFFRRLARAAVPDPVQLVETLFPRENRQNGDEGQDAAGGEAQNDGVVRSPHRFGRVVVLLSFLYTFVYGFICSLLPGWVPQALPNLDGVMNERNEQNMDENGDSGSEDEVRGAAQGEHEHAD